MEPGMRFERALEVPDGIVKTEHRITAASLKLLTTWELGHTLEAVYSVEACVQDLRERYIDGQLDRLLLGLDDHTLARLPTDVAAAVEAPVTQRLGKPGHPEPDLVQQTVEAVVSQLRDYVHAQPIDVD